MDELRFWIAPTEADELPFSDPTSPQSQALSWLQDDPITQTPGRSTRSILERYALAVFYYSTPGQGWEQDNLMSRVDACTWNKGSDDLTGKSPLQLVGADIYGMYCATDGESIDVLSLHNEDLLGPLPWEFFLLTNLRYVNLNFNFLSGTIPPRIGNLTNLEVFSVGKNKLEGSLPRTVGQLSNLAYLDVHGNVLTGTIPSELSRLSLLNSMYLQVNAFTGTVEERFCGQQWSHLGADCMEVDCPCCTICCYDNQVHCDT